MRSLSVLLLCVLAASLLLSTGAVDAQNYTLCQNIYLYNNTYINLSPDHWWQLQGFYTYVNRYNTYTGNTDQVSVTVDLCNATVNPPTWYYDCPPDEYIAMSQWPYATDCGAGYANEPMNVSFRSYPWYAVYFEYYSYDWNQPDPYNNYNRSTVVCNCNNTWGSSLQINSIVTSMSYERGYGNWDNTIYASSPACCAKQLPPGPPAPPRHNQTRCKRIYTPDGQAVIPLENWGALRNTFWSAQQEYQNTYSYQTWNVSLCDGEWYPTANGSWVPDFLRELDGDLRLTRMTRDPYLNTQRQVVFNYEGKSSGGLSTTATVKCSCNPSVDRIQLINNQYKVQQVNYIFQLEFDVFSSACCARPVSELIEEEERKNMGIFRRLVKYIRSFWF